MKNFMEKYNVSRETFEKLSEYHSLLEEWQKKLNLVSKNSFEDAWNRHFADSAQLFKFLPEQAQTLLDFGSGAGFPGMVIAIMAQEKTPYLKVTLVESIKKKTLYLNEVAQRLSVQVTIINDRIENLPPQKVDVITSRAMAPLEKLLDYATPFCKKESVCIFPKGKKYAEELAAAHRRQKFKCRIEASETDAESRILIVSNIQQKRRR